jgi:hypothetical protein
MEFMKKEINNSRLTELSFRNEYISYYSFKKYYLY